MFRKRRNCGFFVASLELIHDLLPGLGPPSAYLTISDVRRFNYPLQPRQLPRSDEVLHRAEELRGRGKGLRPLEQEQ